MGDPFEALGVSRGCSQEELHDAFRALARRWHPDRFMPGPEREWANARMTEISAAYRECADQLKCRAADSSANLDAVHAMIQRERLSEARRALLQAGERGPRWNYLFGMVLQKQGEIAKALTYFNFAVRQAPDNGLYRKARDAVKQLLLRDRVEGVLRALRRQKRA